MTAFDRIEKGLTFEQEQWLCEVIDNWYLELRGILDPDTLGPAKEKLKDRICRWHQAYTKKDVAYLVQGEVEDVDAVTVRYIYYVGTDYDKALERYEDLDEAELIFNEKASLERWIDGSLGKLLREKRLVHRIEESEIDEE